MSTISTVFGSVGKGFGGSGEAFSGVSGMNSSLPLKQGSTPLRLERETFHGASVLQELQDAHLAAIAGRLLVERAHRSALRRTVLALTRSQWCLRRKSGRFTTRSTHFTPDRPRRGHR